MTVLTTTTEQRFSGSGSVGPFTWPWRFLANSDILVYRTDNPGPAETLTLLVEGVDYLLSGAKSYSGGSLVLSTALENGSDLVLRRSTALKQQTSLRNQGNNFLPEVHEDVFDALVMMLQDISRRMQELISSVRVTIYDSVSSPESFMLADASEGDLVLIIPDANDPSAKVTTIMKDSSENVVTIATDTGTVDGANGIDMNVPGESIRLFPNSATNNWVRC